MNKKMTVKDVIKICKGELICGSENTEIEEVTQDTREVKEGYTYIGMKGEHRDGNLMYEEAVKNGAKVCVLQKASVENKINAKEVQEKYLNTSIILVEDTKTNI